MDKQTLATGITGLLSDSERYITELGEISLLKPCRATMESFEIYCCNGDLFEDVERYDTLEEAETRINALLLPRLLT